MNQACCSQEMTAVRRAADLNGSQWRENHQDLVSGVIGGEPEFARPAACYFPAEPGVVVFESHSAACREVELLQAHFVAGDLPEPVHQGRSDALVAVREMGLQVADGPPVGDKGAGLAAEGHPPCEGTVDAGDQYLASLGVKAGSEGIDCRGDLVGADRGERESRSAAGVSDRDPACGQLPSDRRICVAWSCELDDVEVVAGRHGLTVAPWGVIPGSRAAAGAG